MQDYSFSQESIDEMILKYSDETFGIRDVVKFEILLKEQPEYSSVAQINRRIRLKLKSLPKRPAAVGFEKRLADRIEQESRA